MEALRLMNMIDKVFQDPICVNLMRTLNHLRDVYEKKLTNDEAKD